MRKSLFILLLFIAVKTFGQSTPTSPVQVNQMSWYKDIAGHMWAYRGTTLGWIQMVDQSQINSGGGLVKANNGLTVASDSTVQLGGTLNQATSIYTTGGNDFSLLAVDDLVSPTVGSGLRIQNPGANASVFLVGQDISGGHAYSISASNLGLNFNSLGLGISLSDASGLKVSDSRTIKRGFQYNFTDYTNLNDSSLVPKAYVTAAISAATINPDSVLHPNKNLFDLQNKATARNNLKAQRATFVSALDYVTDTTGTTNVSTQLQAAINATPNGGTLWIPRGKYLASGLVVNKAISIRGDNGMLTFNNPILTQIDTTAGTTIISPSATQAVFTMNMPGSNMRDIAIMSKRNVTQTTSYGVYWNNAGYMQMENMTIAGFNTNTYFSNGNFAKFNHIVFENPISTNLLIESPSNPDIGDNTIYDCKFSGFNTTSKDIVFHSSGGLNITNSKFVIRGGGVKGNVIDISMQGSTADINFIGNSVEGFNGTFFKVRRNGFQLNNVQINNNQVTPTGSLSGSLIDIVGAGQTQITNNILTGSPAVGGTFIITLDSVANPMVRNNIIPYGFRLSVAHPTGIVDTATYNNNIALKNANNGFIGNNIFTGITRFQNGAALGAQIGGADVNASTRTNNTRQLYRIVSTDFTTTGNDVSLINADNDGVNHNVNLGYTPSGSNKAATRVSIGAVNSLTATGGTEIAAFDTRGQILSRVQTGVAGTDSLVTHISGGLLKVISPNFYAPIASPTFTGTPTLPTGTIGVTQAAGDNSTKLATTAYVDRNLSTLAIVSSINAKTTGTTALYTVPVGKTAIITSTYVRCTAATSITTGPTVDIGITPGDIYPSTALNSLNTANKTFGFFSTGIAANATAGQTINLNINTAATGTSQTIEVVMLGILR